MTLEELPEKKKRGFRQKNGKGASSSCANLFFHTVCTLRRRGRPVKPLVSVCEE